MSIRFALSGVANGRLSAARMGTLTARMIRARRRIAVWLTAMIGLLLLSAHAGVAASGEEGEDDQQAAAPRQRDEHVMSCRAAEDQRPFGVDQGVYWLMGTERLQPA